MAFAVGDVAWHQTGRNATVSIRTAKEITALQILDPYNALVTGEALLVFKLGVAVPIGIQISSGATCIGHVLVLVVVARPCRSSSPTTPCSPVSGITY